MKLDYRVQAMRRRNFTRGLEGALPPVAAVKQARHVGRSHCGTARIGAGAGRTVVPTHKRGDTDRQRSRNGHKDRTER